MDIFEILDRADLLKRGELNVEAAIKISFPRLLDLLDEVSQATTLLPSNTLESSQVHCASMGLGGSRHECELVKCRAERLDELARYAALYADRVIIYNSLSDMAPTFGHPPPEDCEDFREEVLADLYLLAQIRPIVEGGLIVPFTPQSNVCPSCFAERAFGMSARTRLRRAERKLSQDIRKSIGVIFEKDEFGYALIFSGPKRLLPHGEMVLHVRADLPELPSRIRRRLDAGETIVLSPAMREKLAATKRVSDSILHNLDYQLAVAGAIEGSFLTHRDVDLDVIRYISGDLDLERRNEIAANHLQALVPFAGEVSISDLMTLRNRESEAFIRFRAAMRAAVSEFKLGGSCFSVKDAKELYTDVISPELTRLNQKVTEAKRSLIKEPLVSAAATTATIIFGLYTGLIPAELRTAAEALGVTKIVGDMVGQVVKNSDVTKSIRPEKFYYLWKVQHATRKDH